MQPQNQKHEHFSVFYLFIYLCIFGQILFHVAGSSFSPNENSITPPNYFFKKLLNVNDFHKKRAKEIIIIS